MPRPIFIVPHTIRPAAGKPPVFTRAEFYFDEIGYRLMRSNELHQLVRRGDIEGVHEFLNRRSRQKGDVNTFDSAGSTPLMYAVQGPRANPELVRVLLEAGANVHQYSKHAYQAGSSVLALAL